MELLTNKIFFTALILDDNPNHSKRLKKMLENNYSLDEITILPSVSKSVDFLSSFQPDILFLDIELEDGTGFDVLEQIKDLKSLVIFTTSHSQYAIQAIRFSAVDYLLKPFSKKELFSAVNSALAKFDQGVKPAKNLVSNLNINNLEEVRIGINTSKEIHFVKLSEICFLKAEGAYTTFYLTSNEKIIVSKPIKYYEELLNNYFFLRIHKSTLINLKKVKRYLKKNGGEIELINGVLLDVSRRKKEDLIQLLNKLMKV